MKTIKTNVPEQEFMEKILNMHYSGYEVGVLLGLYAFCNSWNIEKVYYYLDLMGGLDDEM